MALNNSSHKEIWDDSLLVDSWNEALEEYKHYHSIHARGEKVESVLQDAESRDQEDSIEAQASRANKREPSGGGIEESQADDQHVEEQTLTTDDWPANPASNQTAGNAPEKSPSLPQHLIGQVRDESLKNLLMSWYYAGYYTGLYEGQQQGAAGKQA